MADYLNKILLAGTLSIPLIAVGIEGVNRAVNYEKVGANLWARQTDEGTHVIDRRTYFEQHLWGDNEGNLDVATHGGGFLFRGYYPPVVSEIQDSDRELYQMVIEVLQETGEGK